MGKKKKTRRPTEEVNASSMADIAFLLLIFFLVTTTIVNEKGLRVAVPKPQDKDAEILDEPIASRNIFKVTVNSNNELLVSGKIMDVSRLRAEATPAIAINAQVIPTKPPTIFKELDVYFKPSLSVEISSVAKP